MTERGGKRDREIEIVCVSLEDVYERYTVLRANTQRDSVTLRYSFGKLQLWKD